jgi:L-alanine-DL-glutamate epimerase-like enolase superfamily enzyme
MLEDRAWAKECEARCPVITDAKQGRYSPDRQGFFSIKIKCLSQDLKQQKEMVEVAQEACGGWHL